MSGVQIDFNFTAPVKVMLSRVDPKSKQEIPVGTYFFGVITEFASPGTEWRFALVDEKMGYARRGLTYVTTDAPLQHVEVTSVATGEGKFVDKVIVHAVTNPPGIEIPVTGPLTPSTPVTSVTPGVTVTVTPGVNITGTLSGGPISVGSTTSPPGGVPLVGAKDSIFNSESFDKNVIDLEYAIRQQSGLKDKNELRAATYAKLMEIAKAPNPSPEEKAVIDWLLRQVKKTRVEAARLALAEYDKWYSDPWNYQPPQGYDFPAYVIPLPGSQVWLTTTPNPPVLANTSWQSFFAGIISSNGWSPLNNPLLTKGQKNKSIENVVGFPVFGTVLAYQKLYGSDEGARVLAEATAQSGESFTLTPVGNAPIASPFYMRSVYQLNLQRIAPFTYRNMNALLAQIINDPDKFPFPFMLGKKIMKVIANMTDAQLRLALARVSGGDVLASFVASLIICIAIQELISESIMLDTKIKLRAALAAELEKQRSASLPDPKNFFYYDINHLLVTDDYQPTDPVELERLMGAQEAHRAFLLATLE